MIGRPIHCLCLALLLGCASSHALTRAEALAMAAGETDARIAAINQSLAQARDLERVHAL